MNPSLFGTTCLIPLSRAPTGKHDRERGEFRGQCVRHLVGGRHLCLVQQLGRSLGVGCVVGFSFTAMNEIGSSISQIVHGFRADCADPWFSHPPLFLPRLSSAAVPLSGTPNPSTAPSVPEQRVRRAAAASPAPRSRARQRYAHAWGHVLIGESLTDFCFSRAVWKDSRLPHCVSRRFFILTAPN